MLDGRKEIGYGVVISADGHILSKASEVIDAKSLAVTVDQTQYREVKVLAVDPSWDVALLKIEAGGLVPVVYAPTSEVPQGAWVVANGATTRTARRLLAGIVSAKTREIPASGGAALGVVLNGKSKLLEVDAVQRPAPAPVSFPVRSRVRSQQQLVSMLLRGRIEVDDLAQVVHGEPRPVPASGRRIDCLIGARLVSE